MIGSSAPPGFVLRVGGPITRSIIGTASWYERIALSISTPPYKSNGAAAMAIGATSLMPLQISLAVSLIQFQMSSK